MSCTICGSATEDHSSALGCVEALQQQRDALAALIRQLLGVVWLCAPGDPCWDCAALREACRVALAQVQP